MIIIKRKLTQYNRVLSGRDKNILRSIKMCRFLQTDHVARLHFQRNANPTAGLRATSRTLAKLHKMGLIKPLQRRIGGVRAGSSSYVWTLKPAGAALLGLKSPYPHEPTTIFLQHTLAVAELYTRLYTAGNLLTVEFEPSCWRTYTTALGVTITLKPDLYAVTNASDGFEDHWFFEVDLDTEAPSRVMKKCESYARYYQSGREQEETGVFPKVAWIVPDEKRKATLWRHINEHLSEYTDLFVVVTFEEWDELPGEYLSKVGHSLGKGFDDE